MNTDKDHWLEWELPYGEVTVGIITHLSAAPRNYLLVYVVFVVCTILRRVWIFY